MGAQNSSGAQILNLILKAVFSDFRMVFISVSVAFEGKRQRLIDFTKGRIEYVPQVTKMLYAAMPHNSPHF